MPRKSSYSAGIQTTPRQIRDKSPPHRMARNIRPAVEFERLTKLQVRLGPTQMARLPRKQPL